MIKKKKLLGTKTTREERKLPVCFKERKPQGNLGVKQSKALGPTDLVKKRS